MLVLTSPIFFSKCLDFNCDTVYTFLSRETLNKESEITMLIHNELRNNNAKIRTSQIEYDDSTHDNIVFVNDNQRIDNFLKLLEKSRDDESLCDTIVYDERAINDDRTEMSYNIDRYAYFEDENDTSNQSEYFILTENDIVLVCVEIDMNAIEDEFITSTDIMKHIAKCLNFDTAKLVSFRDKYSS